MQGEGVCSGALVGIGSRLYRYISRLSTPASSPDGSSLLTNHSHLAQPKSPYRLPPTHLQPRATILSPASALCSQPESLPRLKAALVFVSIASHDTLRPTGSVLLQIQTAEAGTVFALKGTPGRTVRNDEKSHG